MSDRDRSTELTQLAHDVRNALNGVAVNLEVARTRAQRGVDVTEVTSFLETAAQQLELAMRLHKRYTDAASCLAAGADSAHDIRPPQARGNDTLSHP